MLMLKILVGQSIEHDQRIMQTLLVHRADTNIVDHEGKTAMQIALDNNYKDVVNVMRDAVR
jgi:ankyrin repeat protein